MNTAYYLTMLLGVAWVMIWAILPPEYRGKGWWPFDMRDGEAPGSPVESASGGARRGRDDIRTRDPARKPAVALAEAAQVAKPEAAVAAAPVSWRARRDRAPSSRRGR